MKTTIKTIATAFLAIVFSGSQMLANTTNAHIDALTENDWKSIEETAQLDAMLDIDEIVALKKVSVQNLTMDFKPGFFTSVELGAPFTENERVGVVVVDEEGSTIYEKTGTYGNLKNLHFREYWNDDHTYVVRMYSTSKVYETKLQIAYPQ